MIRFASLLSLPLWLAACSQIPDFVMPKVDVPAAWTSGGQSVTAPSVEVGERWWTVFGSPELDRLEEEALAHNHDLGAAVERIRQAEAQVAAAGASLLPSINASMGQQVGWRNGGSSGRSDGGSSGSGTTRSYQANLSASYEVDFWGGVQGALEAAQASAAASRFAAETVGLTLTASVASTYFQVLALEDRLKVAAANLELGRGILAVVEARVAAGAASEVELVQQRASLASQEASIAALRLERQRSLNALAILVGRVPEGMAVEGGSLASLRLPAVAAGVPAEVLQRRPDLRQAEANLIAANANIGVARAQYFPTVTLTGSGGYSSSYLRTLLDPAGMVASLAANAAVSLFNNGRTAAAVEQARARQAELVAAYQGTVLAALSDVEDNLAAGQWLEVQEQAQQRAVIAARRARELSETRYRIGAADYLTLLEGQRGQLQAEDQAVQVRLSRLNAVVGLAKAVAGGIAVEPGTLARDEANAN